MRVKTFVIAVVAAGTMSFPSMAFAEGYFQQARSIFLNQVQKSYVETKSRLEAGNTDGAKESCKELHDSVRKLIEVEDKVKENLAALGDTPARKAWEDVDKSSRELNVAAGTLEFEIGKADAKTSLSNATRCFEELGRAMDKANGVFTDFGKRWQSVY